MSDRPREAHGAPVYLPPVRDVLGVDIHVEIAGVPAAAVLSAGRELPSGRWMLRQDELPGLRILPSGAFGGGRCRPAAVFGGPARDDTRAGGRLAVPVALEVTFVATDRATGRTGSMTTTVDVAAAWDGAPGRASGGAGRMDSGIRYLLADDAGGRFAIDPYSGLVSVADESVLDPAAAGRHRITVLIASADGSISTKRYEITVQGEDGAFAIAELGDGVLDGDAPRLPAARCLPAAQKAIDVAM